MKYLVKAVKKVLAKSVDEVLTDKIRQIESLYHVDIALPNEKRSSAERIVEFLEMKSVDISALSTKSHAYIAQMLQDYGIRTYKK